MNKKSPINLAPAGSILPKTLKSSEKALFIILAIVYGLVSALWSTYTLITSSLPFFVVCFLAASVMAAAGLFFSG